MAKSDPEKMTAMAKYELKRHLEELAKYSGHATELISLYVPPNRQISFVTSYLKNEFSQSSNIKSKSTRKNVTSAIESILSRLKSYKKPPANGVIFFVGHVATSANQTNMIQHVVEPPMPISTFLYRCDSKFYLEPLLDLLVDRDTFGLIVVDRSEATIGLLRGKRVEVVKHVPSRVPSKHGRGGQSQRRFERLIEIAAHEFFKKVGDIANDAFLDEKDLKGILVGGPGATKEFFVEKNYLHHELKRKVVDLFDTGYTDEYGLRELVQKAENALSDLDLVREKRLIQKLMDEIRKSDGGLSVYGEQAVLDAVKDGIIDTLLVSDGLRKYKLKYRCESCGFNLEEIGAKVEKNNKTCPKCQSEMTLEDSEDIIETLSKLAGEVGTKLELISSDSVEGDMLLKAFNGLAGILRFKVAT
ncbi:peptide chain release factor aRF-1 [[Eubacterium] cellulosolvens]